MIDSTQPRNEIVADIWAKRPERLVTISTGIVHVGMNGHPLCLTRGAARSAAEGITPTCRLCGAEPTHLKGSSE